MLSFSHPDYWISKVNVANVEREETQVGFFKGEPYEDLRYLNDLCADAAPVLVPWLAEAGDEQSLYGEQAQILGAVSDSGTKGGVPKRLMETNPFD